ncbi:MAG: ABC transporter permease subunit [bacterium]|nr:ABC transporter permease subunit [bacterium]
MLHDIWTVAWKEWREYLVGQGGGRFGRLRSLAIILIAGAFIAFSSGAQWATSPLAFLLSSVYLPMVLTLTMVADSFAGERERHTLETLLASRLSDRAILFGKIAALTSYGWLLGLVGAVLSIVIANIGALHEAPFFYTPQTALGIVGLGVLASGLIAGAGCLVSLRAPTVRQAQQTLSLLVIAPFVIGVIGMQLVPESAQANLLNTLSGLDGRAALLVGVLALVTIDGTLVAIALARFRRDRLLLD